MPRSIHLDWANLLVGLLAWAGIAQFAWSVHAAMEVFAPEPIHHSGTYSYAENFLSDLGCTVTDSGKSNAASALIFNRSVIVLGLSLIPFLLQLPANWERGRTAMRIVGVISAAGLIGIGLTPYNRYFLAHHVALAVWLVPLLIIVIAYYAEMFRRGDLSMGLFLVTAFLLMAMLLYAAAGSHSGYVIFQKVTACCAVSWFILVFGRLGIVTVQTFSLPNAKVQRQVRHYVEKIQHGHRRR